MPINIETDDLQTALKKLHTREKTLREIESIAKLGSWEVDLIAKKTIWSEQSYIIYGQERDVQPSLDVFFSHVYPQDKKYVEDKLKDVLHSKHLTTCRCRIVNKKTQEIHYVILSGKTIFDEDGTPIKIIGTTQDITEQVELQKESLELSAIIEESSNEIYIIDKNTAQYLYVNKCAINALGYTLNEILQKNVYSINPALTQKYFNELKKKPLMGKTTNRAIHKCKDGTLYHVQSYIQSTTYKNIEAYIIFTTDISKQVEIEAKTAELEQMAYNDPLTKIYNRQKFNDSLIQAKENKKRYGDKLSLIMFDIDHFKNINDTYGHNIGDSVLITLTKIIQQHLRINDIFARWGGEEFMILLPRTDIDEAYNKAKQLRKSIEKYEDTVIPKFTVSFGVTEILDTDKLESYSIRVDKALYQAKIKRNDVVKLSGQN